MRRWLNLVVVLSALTAMAFTVLCCLALVRVDWIVYGASSDSEPTRQLPSFSLFGVLAWAAVLGLHAYGAVFASRKLVWQPRGFLGALPAGILLWISSMILIAIVHPAFLLHVTSKGFPPQILDVLERIPVLNDIYDHWGIRRQVWWILLLEVLFALGMSVLLEKRPHPEAQ